MKLMHTHFLNAFPIPVDGTLRRSRCRAPTSSTGGRRLREVPPILWTSSRISSDRKKFLLSVVNPSEAVQQLVSSVRRIKLRQRGKLYQIAPPGLNSANEAGKEPIVKIVETEQTSFPEMLQVPPVSVSLYDLKWRACEKQEVSVFCCCAHRSADYIAVLDANKAEQRFCAHGCGAWPTRERCNRVIRVIGSERVGNRYLWKWFAAPHSARASRD